MKLTRKFAENWLALLLVLTAGVTATRMCAQTGQGKVEVKGLMGSASYSMPGGAAVSLEKRAIIPIGSVVKTGPGSAVDLSFSDRAGVVRLLQNSTLSLDRFNVSPGAMPVDIQLYLMEGTMVGFDKK